MEELSFDFIEIKYPELNETGYTPCANIITTGQLRMQQALDRMENKEAMTLRSKLTDEQKYTKDWINND